MVDLSNALLAEIHGRIREASNAQDEQRVQDGIDDLDRALEETLASGELYAQGVHRLRKWCRQWDRVPSSYTLTDAVELESASRTPFSSSALSDVYVGQSRGVKVAVKMLRLHVDSHHSVRKSFMNEVVTWKHLRHPNIVPFLGISNIFPVCVVSEWMSGGTISGFLNDHPGEHRSQYIQQVVCGLDFMHTRGVIHGDLKAANILVGKHPNVRLVDFGLATVLFNSPTPATTATKDGGGTMRFMAPELHAETAPGMEGPKMAVATDIYALTITLWELFSGQLPFEHIRSDFAVMIQVMRGARPSKPSASIEVGFTDDLWDIMQRGWAETPSDRPSLAEFWQVIAPGEITLREHQTVTLLRQALDLLPPGHRDCSNLLDSLADTLWTRFERLGDFVLLAEIIGLHRQALDLRPPGHLDRGISLNNLAAALQTQFDGLGEIDLLEEAVDLHRQALYLRPPGHPDRSSSLNNLASALNTRFEERGDLDVLKEAIELHRQALDLRPPAHPHRSDTLSNLANTLQTLCEQLGDFDSLSEAVQLHREALALRPPGHPDRSDSLNNLASALSTRFVQLGDLDLLTEAIVLHREALELRPPGHPHRSDTLSNLASAFNIRFEQLGDFDSLTEAVDMLRQALDLLQPGHPSRSGLLDHLANALHAQFEQMGDIHVLAEAIVLHRQALGLRLHGHPRRSDTLTNLARALSTRFEQLGDPESLSEAVEILRQALDLLPPGHHGRSGALNNLANALQTRFEQLRDFDLLAEACDLHRHALGLRPPGHPDRPRSLNNLATALHAVSMQTGDHAPLTEAVELLRHALELCPHSHPQRPTSLANLGIILAAYPSHRLLAHNLNERLHLAREGLRLCAGGYHLRMWFLISIAECLLEPGLPFFDFADGIRYVLEGLQDRALPTRKSLRFAVHALRTVEVAQQFMIRYAGDVIQPHDDSMVLQVYRLVLQLFPRAASLAHDHAGRLRELSGADPMSRNAATRAIIMNRGQEAIELLEEGRGLFWAQAHQLRNQDLDLVPDQDAQELRRLFKILEAGDMRNNSMSSMQREQLDEDRRRVVEAAEALIADIRSRPGMSRFLLPPMFSSLVQSMPETGFVIVLVASSLGHRALVLSRTQDQTVSLELFPPKGGFASVSVRGSLPRGGESAVLSAENTNVSRGIRISKGTRDSLGDTLAQLWMSIVKPVIDVLGLKITAGPDRPRVWWCVTGELTFLPIHAAGILGGGYHTEVVGASDYFVSSYTPTLSALSRSRAQWRAVPCSKVTGILAACRGSPYYSTLNSVEREIEVTTTCFKGAAAQVLHLSSPNTAVQVLREALEDQRTNILHLACHGVHAESPLDSAFVLSDGQLTIRDLMSIRLPDAVLAFLSACQTARGSKDLPDQAVHLAASMLFCGFRSVIGTMWLMQDEDGPDLARWFYEGLFARETLDLDDIAYALDAAVTKFRESGVPASRWASFIHVGG